MRCGGQGAGSTECGAWPHWDHTSLRHRRVDHAGGEALRGRSAALLMVFFDVGDTLVERSADPTLQLIDLWRDLDLGGTPAEMASALEAMGHAYAAGCYAPATATGERSLWRALATAALSRTSSGPTEARVRALSDGCAGYARWYRPVPETTRVLQALRQAGRPVGIISNWPPSLEAFLQDLGLGRFEVLACSGPLRCAKPDPGIFHWALSVAGIAASEAWYVGNDPVCDLAPARALGMEAVLWDPAKRYAEGVGAVGTEAELRTALGLPQTV